MCIDVCESGTYTTLLKKSMTAMGISYGCIASRRIQHTARTHIGKELESKNLQIRSLTRYPLRYAAETVIPRRSGQTDRHKLDHWPWIDRSPRKRMMRPLSNGQNKTNATEAKTRGKRRIELRLRQFILDSGPANWECTESKGTNGGNYTRSSNHTTRPLSPELGGAFPDLDDTY